ncbi:MAG: type II toxin-antitoxin system VapC family toxin [Pyrinomonadaceae bacterium]
MPSFVTDTHAAIWHLGQSNKLSKAAISAVKSAEQSGGIIYVSTITIVEMIYLVEKERILPDILRLLRSALNDSTTVFQIVELNRAVTDALERIPRSDVPDTPDRIIAATAFYLDLPLITRDGKIRTANIQTIW